MKNPQYKIGDYVEFKCWNGKFDLRTTADVIKKGFITGINKGSRSDTFISTRSGKQILIMKSEIIRKLPINRDKNGRFSRQCEKEVTEQYEAERKPYDEFGSRPESIDTPKINKTEKKKPSEILDEKGLRIQKENPLSHPYAVALNAIVEYLDEQFEKGKK